MKRKCELLICSGDGKRAIYLDEENKAAIMAYLTSDDRHRKKFRFIAAHILEGLRNTEIYDKEDINKNCSDVTAMKFFKGQENDRIYCKEISTKEGVFVVIAAILHQKKKSQKNSSKEISLIEKVGGYTYEIEK
ncbi:MAG: hypothetical protein ACRCYO_07385 [Bacteroidia bacterium]